MMISVKGTIGTHAGNHRCMSSSNLRMAVINLFRNNNRLPPFQTVYQLRQKQDTQRASI